MSTEEILGKTYKKNSENCTKDIVKKSTITLYILPLMLYSDNRLLCPHERRHYKDKSPPQSFFGDSAAFQRIRMITGDTHKEDMIS